MITDFEYYNPVRIFFGKDQISKIAGQIPSGSKIMLLYGGGSIFRNGVHEKITETLSGAQKMSVRDALQKLDEK